MERQNIRSLVDLQRNQIGTVEICSELATRT